MGRGKAHWRWQTARQRVQSRRDSSWLWWRVHLPLVRSTLRTLAQARLHQSARSIRGPRAPTYVYTGCVFWGWTTCSLALSLFPPLPSPSPAPTPVFRGARFHAGTRIGTRIGTRCVVEIGSIVERGRRVTKVRRLLGSSYGRTVIIINDPRVVLI